MSTVLTIAAIGGKGPKATSVAFGKTEDGVRQWAWVPNSVAEKLAPGMTVIVEAVSVGKVEKTYTDKVTKTEVALKVPKQQLFLGGEITVDAPDAEPLPEAQWKVSDAATAYREAYHAKRQAEQATNEGAGDTEDFG